METTYPEYITLKEFNYFRNQLYLSLNAKIMLSCMLCITTINHLEDRIKVIKLNLLFSGNTLPVKASYLGESSFIEVHAVGLQRNHYFVCY